MKMAKKYRVLVSDKISQKALETLQDNNIEFDYIPDCGTSDTLIEVIEPYDSSRADELIKTAKHMSNRSGQVSIILLRTT